VCAPAAPSTWWRLPSGRCALDRVLDGRDVRTGDILLGLESSGLHSNGYTLARRVLLGEGRLALDAHMPELNTTLADELLKPTRIYVKPVLQVLDAGVPVRALAHVTGDGPLQSRAHREAGRVRHRTLARDSAIFACCNASAGSPKRRCTARSTWGSGSRWWWRRREPTPHGDCSNAQVSPYTFSVVRPRTPSGRSTSVR
jgi:hypothetical protein